MIFKIQLILKNPVLIYLLNWLKNNLSYPNQFLFL